MQAVTPSAGPGGDAAIGVTSSQRDHPGGPSPAVTRPVRVAVLLSPLMIQPGRKKLAAKMVTDMPATQLGQRNGG